MNVLLAALALLALGDSELTSYRSWELLTPAPRAVPYDVSLLCMIPTDDQMKMAGKKHGIHAWRWIKVYANPTAAAAWRDERVKVFPVGSMIVKEKLTARDDSEAEGVAFMVKHPKGRFDKSGGWEFIYKPGSTRQSSYDGCINCHRVGGKRDYVFGQYGSAVSSR